MKKISQNKLIVVLGMHRSGTSVITRGLQVMGVELGNRLSPPIRGNNEKGFWEDIDLNALNIEILNFLNMDWHFLTPIQSADVGILRRNGYLLRAIELLQEKTSGIEVFGFKDPRVAKLLPFWKEVFTQSSLNVSYVLSARHPLSVCKSLAKRDRFDFEKSYQLWLEHVINSLIGTAEENRILANYDRLLQSPEAELTRVADKLQLKINLQKLENFKTEFLDEKLRHSFYQIEDLKLDEAMPPLVQEVYSEILNITINNTRLEDTTFKNTVVRWNDELSRQKSTFILVDKLTSNIISTETLLNEANQKVASISAQLKESEKVSRDLLATLQEIYSSRAWKFIQIMWKLRRSITPPGTRRELVLQQLIRILLAPFRKIR